MQFVFRCESLSDDGLFKILAKSFSVWPPLVSTTEGRFWQNLQLLQLQNLITVHDRPGGGMDSLLSEHRAFKTPQADSGPPFFSHPTPLLETRRQDATNPIPPCPHSVLRSLLLNLQRLHSPFPRCDDALQISRLFLIVPLKLIKIKTLIVLFKDGEML